MLSVRLDGVEDALKKFDPKVVARAAVLTLNECASKAKTEADRQTRSRLNMQQKDVGKKIKISKAKGSDLRAILSVEGRPLGLMNFGAQQFSGRRKVTAEGVKVNKRKSGKSGVYVKIRKGGGATRLSTAFISTGIKGNLHVFQRKTGGKLVRRAMITLPSIVRQTEVYRPMLKVIDDTWTRRFPHQLFRLSSQ